MLTPEECKVVIQFLDRTSIIGHSERSAMNAIINKLAVMAQPQKPTVVESCDNIQKGQNA